MEKNSFGKGIGIGGALAIVVGILCQVFDSGATP
jgi:hypothetical protein